MNWILSIGNPTGFYHSIDIQAYTYNLNKFKLAISNNPPCILSLDQGLELTRESGEPMECGIFDLNRYTPQLCCGELHFYEVFSRAFGEEEEDGKSGSILGGNFQDNSTHFKFEDN